MQAHSLILGGTKGLGRAIAKVSIARKIRPIVVGRSAVEARKDTELADALFYRADLSDPNDACGVADGLYGSGGLGLGLDRNKLDFVFWVAGRLIRRDFSRMSIQDARDLMDTNFFGPLFAIQAIHRLMKPFLAKGLPYHLVVIASTSSWRIRDSEAIYCASKAAQAHFTRNFARELVRDLPGSKVTLVNPGGIRTELFKDAGQDVSKFMDPDVVAAIIWNKVLRQRKSFVELQIMRNEDGTPRVREVARAPERPL
ncbi:MAG: SDR family oxidoreductase [Candidatus Liptonbacteria bacterium]|nr:SDR family oxidoreductase [Candidatus Liptonbacteria bacterium]